LVFVNEDFFTDQKSWYAVDWYALNGTTGITNYTNNTEINQLQALVLGEKYRDVSLFDNLTITECFARYDTDLTANGGTVFAVSDEDGSEYNRPATNRSTSFLRKISGYSVGDYLNHSENLRCK
jgi:hypothetical protein